MSFLFRERDSGAGVMQYTPATMEPAEKRQHRDEPVLDRPGRERPIRTMFFLQVDQKTSQVRFAYRPPAPPPPPIGPADEYFQRVFARRLARERQPSRRLAPQIFIHSFPHLPPSGLSRAGGIARSPAPDHRSPRTCRFPSSTVSDAPAVSVSGECPRLLVASGSRKSGAACAA